MCVPCVLREHDSDLRNGVLAQRLVTIFSLLPLVRSCDLGKWLCQGVDAAFDSAEAEVAAAEASLEQYLAEIRRRLGRGISYVNLNKESHLLEVPEVRPLALAHPYVHHRPVLHHEPWSTKMQLKALGPLHHFVSYNIEQPHEPHVNSI